MGLRGRGRAAEKKNYKKGLQISVSHGIMDSNKEPQQAVKEVTTCLLYSTMCLTKRK